jgi:hypothetical protein
MVAYQHDEGTWTTHQWRGDRYSKPFQGGIEVTNALSGFIASIGIAMVITALTLPNRKAKDVIDSTANGAVRLVEAALGQHP